MEIIKNKKGIVGGYNPETVPILYIVIILIIGFIIGGFAFGFNSVKLQQENEMFKEELSDFMGYTMNTLNYCIELNNMTTEELFKGFLEQQADKIIEEAFPEKVK